MVSLAIYEGIKIPAGKSSLAGELEIPHGSTSLVLFSHGSGSSRLSPRNQAVAQSLRDHGIGTFLFDLLTREEDNRHVRFDIDLLTTRLLLVTDWLRKHSYASKLNLGYFGASTGAASALNAAAKLGKEIKAVVSRGGRPDLAMSSLHDVHAATLLIVGELDEDVLDLNEIAFDKLNRPKKLVVIPGATHLFEEKGKLERVAELASQWFDKYLISE
jgi:putative phosphoribosyl transferase